MNRRIYNPFLKIEKYANEELVMGSTRVNGHTMKVATLWIEDKIEFQDLMMAMRKINYFYGMVLALRSGLSPDKQTEKPQDPLSIANKHFLRFISSIPDGYELGFRTTARVPILTKKGENKRVVMKDLPRSSIIFTRAKEGGEINHLHFFRNKPGVDMINVLEECRKLVKSSANRCKSLFIKKKLYKGAGIYNINAVHGSYINNINDLIELIKEYEKLGISLQFDVMTCTKNTTEMVEKTLEFQFRRKWMSYPITNVMPKERMEERRRTCKTTHRPSKR